MRLSAPKKSTFWISIVLLVVGILGHFFIDAIKQPVPMYFMIVSNLLLIAGCCIKDF